MHGGVSAAPAAAPQPARAEIVLRLQGVSIAFGGLRVLTHVSFDVRRDQVAGLIGPNGAGKSTCFNVITSVYRPDTGSVQLAGVNLVGMASHEVCRRGVARTFQLVRTFQRMTALQNVLVGALYGARHARDDPQARALDALALVGLSEQRDRDAAHMTLSDRRLLEIARALATAPALMLLDEPMAGLNESEIESMTAVIRRVRDQRGISVLWVEHKVDAIMAACDHVIVLHHGEKIAEGTPAQIVSDRSVIEAYLGEPAAA